MYDCNRLLALFRVSRWDLTQSCVRLHCAGSKSVCACVCTRVRWVRMRQCAPGYQPVSDVQFVTLRGSVRDGRSDARDTRCYNIDGCAGWPGCIAWIFAILNLIGYWSGGKAKHVTAIFTVLRKPLSSGWKPVVSRVFHSAPSLDAPFRREKQSFPQLRIVHWLERCDSDSRFGRVFLFSFNCILWYGFFSFFCNPLLFIVLILRGAFKLDAVY